MFVCGLILPSGRLHKVKKDIKTQKGFSESFSSLWKFSLRQVLMNFELGHFTFFSLCVCYTCWSVEQLIWGAHLLVKCSTLYINQFLLMCIAIDVLLMYCSVRLICCHSLLCIYVLYGSSLVSHMVLITKPKVLGSCLLFCLQTYLILQLIYSSYFLSVFTKLALHFRFFLLLIHSVYTVQKL